MKAIYKHIIDLTVAVYDFFADLWLAFGQFAGKSIMFFFDFVFASWDLLLLTAFVIMVFYFLFQKAAPDLSRKIHIPRKLWHRKKRKHQRPLPFKEQQVQIGDVGYTLEIKE